MASSLALSPDQIEFTNAFNNQRELLAGFASCANQSELHIVRDGWYLGLAHDLLPVQYEPVQRDIIVNPNMHLHLQDGNGNGFARTIDAARQSAGWETLVAAVKDKADTVGSNIEGIWTTLETGRLEWLQAASGAHGIKMWLKQGFVVAAAKDDSLNHENGGSAALRNSSPTRSPNPNPGDVSDAKMLWMYSLCVNLPSLTNDVHTWAKMVQLSDEQYTQPLVGYRPELWDPRKEEWRPLDLGAQAAAERGGSTLEDAWNAE
jgi:hypothetical protein